MASEVPDAAKSAYPSLGLGNSFAFKLEDHKGRVHRFNCGKSKLCPWNPWNREKTLGQRRLITGSEDLGELVSAVAQRTGVDFCQEAPQLLVSDAPSPPPESCHPVVAVWSSLLRGVFSFSQYEDDEGDRVLLSTDADLSGAVNHARISGWKVFYFLYILIYGDMFTFFIYFLLICGRDHWPPSALPSPSLLLLPSELVSRS